MTPEETRVYGHALGAIGRLQAALDSEQWTWLEDVSVRRTIETFDEYPSWSEFDLVTADVEAIDAEVRLLGGADWAGRYWQLVTLHFVARSMQGPRPFVLPPSMLQGLLVDLERIVDQTASGAGVDDPLGDPGFLLDLALSRGVALPMDSCVAVPMWVPEPVGDFTAGLWLHLHFRDLAAIGFKPEVVNRSTPFMYDFLEANPECRGWFGVTWLIDPQLVEVSPHLSWYRDVVVAAGALMSPADTDEQTVSDATSTSQARRGLFEQGQYQPRDYRMLFPREATLRWYENTAHLLPPPANDPRAAAAYGAK